MCLSPCWVELLQMAHSIAHSCMVLSLNSMTLSSTALDSPRERLRRYSHITHHSFHLLKGDCCLACESQPQISDAALFCQDLESRPIPQRAAVSQRSATVAAHSNGYITAPRLHQPPNIAWLVAILPESSLLDLTKTIATVCSRRRVPDCARSPSHVRRRIPTIATGATRA